MIKIGQGLEITELNRVLQQVSFYDLIREFEEECGQDNPKANEEQVCKRHLEQAQNESNDVTHPLAEEIDNPFLRPVKMPRIVKTPK